VRGWENSGSSPGSSSGSKSKSKSGYGVGPGVGPDAAEVAAALAGAIVSGPPLRSARLRLASSTIVPPPATATAMAATKTQNAFRDRAGGAALGGSRRSRMATL
jgi:hypothetical protein